MLQKDHLAAHDRRRGFVGALFDLGCHEFATTGVRLRSQPIDTNLLKVGQTALNKVHSAQKV